MTRDEAKQVLLRHQPGLLNPDDGEMNAALQMVEQDAELRDWFEAHCARQAALRAAFRSVQPPEGLKQQILSERPAPVAKSTWRKPAVVTLVTLLAIAIVGSSLWWKERSELDKELSYATYRGAMVNALRMYAMDMETNSTPAIREYLAQQQALADFELPQNLAAAKPTGCGVLNWQGNSVTMVCFHSGRPLRPGEQTDLFLFIMPKDAALRTPPTGAPQIAQENRMVTATWTTGNLVYLLATEGDESFLRNYL